MKNKCRFRALQLLVGLGALLHFSNSAPANVYATNLKLNNSTNNAAVLRGSSVNIGYILNEVASAGVMLKILSGTNVVRTISVAAGNPGTARGTNLMVWDGKDDLGSNVVAGAYSFRITAGANGFDAWTQISDDNNPGNQVLSPKGIAVNRNTNSPFYGRVFVGNAPNGTPPSGSEQGIYKHNADGSFAEEGRFSAGGYPWSTGSFRAYSPWKVEVSGDDKVYVNDWADNGIVMAFDPEIKTNNYLNVLRADNWPADGLANLSGPFITGTGTNTQVWMADINYLNPAPGVGLVRWNVTPDGTLATNDFGTTIVQARWPSDLNLYPYDMALDKDGHIYTIQYRQTNDTSPRVLRFPPYDESGTPETHADWKIGGSDSTLVGASGVAVDPDGTHVAVAVRGLFNGSIYANGGLQIFEASSGVLITNISIASNHDHPDVAWDNAGNLYDLDNFDGRWRVYSPPGTNQATTVALGIAQVFDEYNPPVFLNAAISTNQFQSSLLGQPNVTYLIQASTNLLDWATVSTNYSPNATRIINVSMDTEECFYRARVNP